MYTILLVDDSETVRAVIAKTLAIAAVPISSIFEAGNGQEALQILEREWIDLVFADIHMPVMNGLELVEKMAADGLLKTIPVVVVSTESSRSRLEELKAKGISAYIRKPFTPELIRQVVSDLIGV